MNFDLKIVCTSVKYVHHFIELNCDIIGSRQKIRYNHVTFYLTKTRNTEMLSNKIIFINLIRIIQPKQAKSSKQTIAF